MYIKHNDFSWAWTVDRITGKDGAGLQGSIEGKAELVWYKNQKQHVQNIIVIN